jgi:hypothetical protein
MEQLASEPAPVEPEPVELAVAVPEAAEVPAEVGPGFLPPEPEAPQPEPDPQPRPVIATRSGEMAGPVAIPAERPVQLATRLPSAFDFAPAPAATPALPIQTSAPASPTDYTSFHSFAVNKLVNPPPRTGRESMLLLDPPSLDPALVRCGTLPPAVLVDLDPAGSLVQVVSEDGTPSSPDLANYLADLRQRGVAVYWISGHGPENASAIRRRLVASGLDPAGRDPLIVTRFVGESKQARRQALGETNCLLAIAGDQRGDFDELYDYVLDPAIAAPLEQHVGNGWFLAPPPLN